MHWDDGNTTCVPACQHQLLTLQVWLLTPGEHALCVAHLAHGHLNKRAEMPAARKLVLDVQAPSRPETAQPLGIDLALKVKVYTSCRGMNVWLAIVALW